MLYVNSRPQYEGALKYMGESVTGTTFGLRKRWWGLGVAVVTRDSGSDVSKCADELWHFFVHTQWFSHGKSRADNCDVIKWCHSDCSCYWERKVYKESKLKPWGCHLGFWHWIVGSIVKSLTLYSGYISASHGSRVYPGWTVYLVYSCACTKTFWEDFR